MYRERETETNPMAELVGDVSLSLSGVLAMVIVTVMLVLAMILKAIAGLPVELKTAWAVIERTEIERDEAREKEQEERQSRKKTEVELHREKKRSKRFQQLAADGNKRTKEVLEFAEAFGIPALKGALGGVVLLVDLSMEAEGRASVQKLILKLPMERFTVVGFGNGLYATSSTLLTATDKNRQAACKALDGWPRAPYRPTIDAIDIASEIEGVTQTILCTRGLPDGGTAELLELVERRVKRPINTINYGERNAGKTKAFLRRIAEETNGSYRRG